MTNRDKERILEEIKLYEQLDHPNVLKMIKAWRNKNKDEVVMITELMTSSLKEYIHRNSERPRLKVIKMWCKSILKALEYFHSRNPPVIHRDLKCDNIFISSSNAEIRIGDLGFSTTLKESHLKSQVGTPYFMAPEMYEERYGTGVDIYSFGLCIIEMCTLSTPYSECKNQSALLSKLKAMQKPEAFDLIQDDEVKDFISLCILPADQRPTASELLKHNFLKIQEEDTKINEPVFIVMQDPKEQKKSQLQEVIFEEFPNDNLKVILLIKNPDESNFRIEFMFNPNEDVPEQIVEELLNKVDASKETLEIILEALEKKIFQKNPLKHVEQTTPRFSHNLRENTYNISLKLGVQNLNSVKKFKVDFEYDPEKDNPEGVTEDIIHKLELDPEDYSSILAVVKRKISEQSIPGSNTIPYMDLLDMNNELTIAPTKIFNSTTESVNSEIKSMGSSKGSGAEIFIRTHYNHREDPFSGNLSPITSYAYENKCSPAKSDEEDLAPKTASKLTNISFSQIKGKRLRKLKKALNLIFCTTLKQNDEYDEEAKSAIKKFQNIRGLKSDGLLTQQTYDLVMSICYSGVYKSLKKPN